MLIHRLSAMPQDHVVAIDDTGKAISSGALLERAGALAKQIGPARALVLLECRTSVDWLVAYVAVHLGNHAALLLAQGAPVTSALVKAFDANVVMQSKTGFVPERLRPNAPAMHPDLRLMLSTSGSTGSPKCVRLSDANLWSNAEAITVYLKIGTDERGIASLPVHYSYGLSIVNSHLWAGATLLMTERSVIEPAFWDFAQEYGATSLGGVPHSYDLLTQIDFEVSTPKSLRYLTQAGGKLRPERVAELGAIAAQRGWRFYIMYGQTEASPRMAYLPPERIDTNPDAIGVAIPGGRLSVQDEKGAILEPDTEGELVYEGPNVMMGYAMQTTDLIQDAGPPLLRTGDLARMSPDGIFEITGRMSRFVKIFGNRIGLDEVEAICSEVGTPAVATGIDDKLLVVTRDANASLRRHVADRLKLPQTAIEMRVVEDYPLLSTGKVDYATLKASIGADEKDPAQQNVSAIYARHLSVPASEISLDTSFEMLGGDSLSYVSVALDLENILGVLPEQWEKLPISALENITPSRSLLGRIDSPTAVRAFAICLIVLGHFGVFNYGGTGAFTLFLVAGMSFSSLTVPAVLRSNSVMPVFVLLLRIAFLTWSYITLNWLVTGYGGIFSYLFITNWIDPDYPGGVWFVGVYIQIVLLLTGMFFFQLFRVRAQQHAFETYVVLTLILICLLAAFEQIVDTNHLYRRLPHLLGWLFTCGIVMHCADTVFRKSIAVFLFFIGYWIFSDMHIPDISFIMLAVPILAFVPYLPLPRLFIPAVRLVAGASLIIYLSHFLFRQVAQSFGLTNPVLFSILALCGGVVCYMLYRPIDDRIRSILSRNLG